MAKRLKRALRRPHLVTRRPNRASVNTEDRIEKAFRYTLNEEKYVK
jgi:hypothetical protein